MFRFLFLYLTTLAFFAGYLLIANIRLNSSPLPRSVEFSELSFVDYCCLNVPIVEHNPDKGN